MVDLITETVKPVVAAVQASGSDHKKQQQFVVSPSELTTVVLTCSLQSFDKVCFDYK